MSRYQYTAGRHTVVVGWDNPLETYFAQVWRGKPESAENLHPQCSEIGPHPWLWLGTQRGHVPTLEALADNLRPYGEIPPDIAASLRRDHEEFTSRRWQGDDPTNEEWAKQNGKEAEPKKAMSKEENHSNEAGKGTNQEFVRRADNALSSYRDEDPADVEANLTDCLTDLKHWSDAHGVDFDKQLARAEMHHRTEVHWDREHAKAHDRRDGEKNTYAVRVVEQCRLWGVVQVHATHQEEAEQLAAENFVPNWEDSDVEERWVTVLTENGVPVKPDWEAWERDDKNPYRKVQGTVAKGPHHEAPDHPDNQPERSPIMSAWRPYENLIAGELDNTQPGRVTGWLTFFGKKEVVTLDLKGDFHRDIRGTKICLTNPNTAERFPDREGSYMDGLATLQRGTVGDMTAGQEPKDYGDYPYFEWYSEENGRVVLELGAHQVQVIGTPRPWQQEQPVSREEQERNMGKFLAGLSAKLGGVPAMVAEVPPEKPPPKANARTSATTKTNPETASEPVTATTNERATTMNERQPERDHGEREPQAAEPERGGKNKPLARFESGAVRGFLWDNGDREPTLTVSRIYKHQESGEWRYAQSFRAKDFEHLARVTHDASQAIEKATEQAVNQEPGKKTKSRERGRDEDREL
jgi:hypothetical protein